MSELIPLSDLILQQRKKPQSLAKQKIEAFMRMTGIEPARLAAHDPKSCTSASSATSAWYKYLTLNRVRAQNPSNQISII